MNYIDSYQRKIANIQKEMYCYAIPGELPRSYMSKFDKVLNGDFTEVWFYKHQLYEFLDEFEADVYYFIENDLIVVEENPFTEDIEYTKHTYKKDTQYRYTLYQEVTNDFKIEILSTKYGVIAGVNLIDIKKRYPDKIYKYSIEINIVNQK